MYVLTNPDSSLLMPPYRPCMAMIAFSQTIAHTISSLHITTSLATKIIKELKRIWDERSKVPWGMPGKSFDEKLALLQVCLSILCLHIATYPTVQYPYGVSYLKLWQFLAAEHRTVQYYYISFFMNHHRCLEHVLATTQERASRIF